MAENTLLDKLGGGLGVVGLAAQGIKAGLGLVSGLSGLNKQKRLWATRPQLGVTEGERGADAIYNTMAAYGELPGQRQYIDKMNEAVASGVYDAQRTANSSLGATQAAVDLNSKKISAIQDLATQFADFKTKRMDALAEWNKAKGDLETQRWATNEYEPWGIKMNEAVDQKTKGFAGFGSAVDSGLGMVSDLAGTNNFLKTLKTLYPNLG